MAVDFKRVPAVDKCFAVLDLISSKDSALGISDMASALGLNKSTVFNLAYTLTDLGVLENTEGKFRFGPRFYQLGRAAERGSDLIRIVHPFLRNISRDIKLPAFLGVHSGNRTVILDKVDAPVDLKVSSDVGTGIPLLAGATCLAILAQFSPEEVAEIVSREPFKRFTPHTPRSKKTLLKRIAEVRAGAVGVDMGEYLQGTRALAVPLNLPKPRMRSAIWVVGLDSQITEESIPTYAEVLQEAAEGIRERFFS